MPTMNVNSLLVLKIVIDILICAGILFLLFRVKLFKPGLPEISEKTTQEFAQLLIDSRNYADEFLEELEKEKESLKDLLYDIGEREKRLKDFIKESRHYSDLLSSENPGLNCLGKKDAFSENAYGQILSLARKGFNEEQISQQSGLPEGEVDLILNLTQAKNESPQ